MKTKKKVLKKTKVVKTKTKVSPKSEVLKIRMKNNLTQTLFAKKLGISQSHLCKIERGDQKINIDIARTLHKIYKVPSSKLLTSNI
jgi:transcriptional regulator with XRE-family HTH domain